MSEPPDTARQHPLRPDPQAPGAGEPLLECFGALETAADLEQVMRVAARALAERGRGVGRTFVLIPEREGGLLVLRWVAGAGTDASSRAPLELRLPLDEREDPAVAATREECLSPAPAPRPAPLWHALGVERLGAQPVRVGGRVVAVLAAEPAASDGEVAACFASRLDLAGRLASLAAQRASTAAELRQREHEAQLLQEVARSALSPLNLAEGLSRVTRVACQALNARGSALWVTDGPGDALRLEATYGPAANRERLSRGLERVARDCAAGRRLVLVEDPVADARLEPEVASALSCVACLPVAAYDRVHGVLAVYDLFARWGGAPGGFTRADLAFAELLADHAGVMLAHAALFERIRRAEKGLEDARGYAAHLQHAAALGESALRVSREARHPLASIAGFARRVHRALPADDPHREYLEVVIREAERLERLVGEQLDLAEAAQPRWKVEGVNPIVQEALQELSEELVRKRVRLLKKLAPDLPPLLLDAEKIRLVMSNILRNALEGVPPGGRVRVESRRAQRFVVVEVAHDGARLPGDLAEHLFVPFALGRSNAPGVGLAVARQIVQGHGGEIRLRSEGDWGAVFSFTLPIHENQDRRAAGRTDRRRASVDRRRRFPAA
jgi:signal transduction histidine kinase